LSDSGSNASAHGWPNKPHLFVVMQPPNQLTSGQPGCDAKGERH
jgi:hypothetical protein